MSMRNFNALLVTGGYGFIGSNFIRYLLQETGFQGRIINLDKLTYAGNPHNLGDIEPSFSNRYSFVNGDICDSGTLQKIYDQHRFDGVIHFAAESHVDRSIYGPAEFIQTNINGTFSLLECARKNWPTGQGLFHHVSTDEVFGSLGDKGFFTESTAYDPHSPYSASKAASDHLVKAYHHTYGLNITLSNCSNNYGPYQFPEKLIPLMILNAIDGKRLPVYGDGRNIRDWLYVEDHCRGIWRIVQSGGLGETYNIGGHSEKTNLDVVRTLCELLEGAAPAARNPRLKEQGFGAYNDLLQFVKDRPGHDRRYAIDCRKIEEDLGWQPTVSFAEGLKRTIRWYLDHPDWVRNVQNGTYRQWLDHHYGQ
jgi:dTDP-glucose 4,6-dehydratase